MEEFEQIYDFYFRDVYKYAFSLCRSHAQAEEITQETFCRALKSMSSFRGECRMFVWLCQIAKHIYFAGLQKEKRQSGRDVEEVLEAGSLQPACSMEQQLLDEADAMELHRHLHCLPEPYKEVFMLRVFGELSFKKIGQIFNKTENWARTTYHRGKLKIIQEMEKSESNGGV
ncbi:MAG: RNA polymerase sigma factor [Lachnospiraceae bacterium]|nr:RNA polymerase sigma factor [Lachnospiraceae bacterium]